MTQAMEKSLAEVYERKINELQKLVAAKDRELEIEAALERVRFRTVAMDNSSELDEVLAVLWEQFDLLRIRPMSAHMTVIDIPNNRFTFRETGKYGNRSFGAQTVAIDAMEIWKETAETWRGSEPDTINRIHFPKELLPVVWQVFHESFASMPEDSRLTPDDYPDGIYHTAGKHPFGYIGMNQTRKATEEEEQIVVKFANEFGRAYQRFLDLQKAEAQARETQVQLSLERVRARTMAMQESDELPDAANLLFEQMQILGISALSVGYCIWDEDKEGVTSWMSNGGVMQPSFHIKVSDEPTFVHVKEAYERGETFYVEEVGGEQLTRHYQYMRSLPVIGESINSLIDSGHTLPTLQIFHSAFFSKGLLMFITYEPVPEAHDIFKRFGKVFDQTYTRFLDLQKAEAQAREARIEAALERVRSRTVSMHKSEELRDVIQTVFEQLSHLDFKIDSAHFNLNYNDSDDYNLWTAAPGQPYPLKTHIPYFDHPVFITARKAKEEGLDFFTEAYSKEEKNSFFEHLFTDAPHIPEDRRKYILNKPGVAASTVILNNISLWIMNYSSIPYSAAENEILKRFGKIFEQSHIRFLDLQKAEAQAREAIKQASLDRIRAEIASMRTTGDLEKIIPLIWNELTILGVRFIRCGVFIMDNLQQIAHTYLSTPDGKAVAAFDQPYDGPGKIPEIVRQWQNRKFYTEYWDEEAYTAFAEALVQMGVFTSPDQYFSSLPGGGFYLHFAPFLQGMLYVGNTSPLPEEEINLIQSVGNAFSTAYARYEDFNKLEAAKQQVDRTLLDLKQAQQQLIQAEKMASLGQLTAGISHEIQNPLNFINNFSEVNKELIAELIEEIERGNFKEVRAIAADIEENEQKINHHGRRASSIVKGMLQHSRASSGKREPTDINALADEYLRLAYHGLRAKDKFFNATMMTDFDETIGSVNIIPQDIGGVILNLITNAFYSVVEKAKQYPEGYEPLVLVSTKKIDNNVELSVKDNGNGISENVVDKIFQPFFTTKPTGQGTGLGLSLSYDIIKAHGGELNVDTKEGHYAEFTIKLPINQS